jgi:leucyl-tRNA synthetase
LAIHTSPFPEFDETRIARSTAEIVVQVNSKIRGHLVVPVHADEDAIVELVMADEKIVKHFDGKTIRKRIVVPGKLINFIIS